METKLSLKEKQYIVTKQIIKLINQTVITVTCSVKGIGFITQTLWT
jgi:hypothetical protein